MGFQRKELHVGLWARITSIFGAKANKALDKLENPAESLDYSYQKQLGLLNDVRRGLAEVATSKQRLRMQAEKLQQQDSHLQQQAQQALVANREDLARMALQRRQTVSTQIDSLHTQIVQLDEQQARLSDASQQLQTKVEEFRTRKETLKAQYSASSAQVKINESFSGISSEMSNIGSTLQRATDRIEQMQARSAALDELIDSGALQDYTQQLSGTDDIDRQLRLATGGSSVDAELEAMKAQLAGGEGPKQLEAKPEAKPKEEPSAPPAPQIDG
jgi:phage shock protein A